MSEECVRALKGTGTGNGAVFRTSLTFSKRIDKPNLCKRKVIDKKLKKLKKLILNHRPYRISQTKILVKCPVDIFTLKENLDAHP